MSRLNDESIRGLFPNLCPGRFHDTSDPTPVYNCMAWAAAQTHVWWEPAEGYYWPPHAPFDYRPDSLIKALAVLGFERCESSNLEDGFEKLALYADGEEWTHAARQKSDGTWTSKLGSHQDIEHPDPESVSGDTYGHIFCLMRRPIAPPPAQADLPKEEVAPSET